MIILYEDDLESYANCHYNTVVRDVSGVGWFVAQTLLQCFLQRTTFLLARIAGQLFEMDADDYIDRSFVGKKAGGPKNIRGRVEGVIATQGQYLWLVLSKRTHVSCFHCFVFFPFPSTLKLHLCMLEDSNRSW